MIGVPNGLQTISVPAIQCTCAKIANHLAVRVGGSDDTGCKDFKEDCYESSESGECLLTKCAFWAQQWECESNPTYMLDNCSKSCEKF
jgi:hypothetical protein